MPTVSLYGGRKVAPEALPAARRTAAETSTSTGADLERARAEKFGAVAQLGATTERSGDLVHEILRREQTKADQLAVMHAENELVSWELTRLHDAEKGALSVRGAAAFDLPEQIAVEYEQQASDIGKRLKRPAQQQAFARIRANRGAGVALTIHRHVAGERQRFAASTLEATVENGRNEAIANATNPARVGAALGRAVRAIETLGPELGLGAEAIKNRVEAVRTQTHVGVVEQLIALEQTKAATVYFEETRDQITGEAVAKIKTALKTAGTRREAQEQADAILSAGGTLTEQREKARKLDDPEVRDSVMQRLEHEATVRSQIQQQADEARLRTAYDVLDRRLPVEKIPPAIWAEMSGNERSAARAYAKALAKGIDIETDFATYYALIQQAGDEPEKFVAQPLLAYRAKLGDVELKQLASLQLSIRTGDREAKTKILEGFRTRKEIVDDTLTQYGIDPKAKPDSAEGRAIAQLQRMLDLRVDAAQDQGQKVTNTEIQGVLDDLLSRKVTTPGAWWAIWPGGRPVTDRTKRRIELTIDDVSATDRAEIEQALREQRLPVTDATVLDYYIEAKSRKP